jgi:hypothetical protein
MDADFTSNIIRIKVDDVLQLFNTFDPTPFWDRDIDTDAEEFIVDWARDLPKREPIRIVIYVRDAQAQKFNPAQVNEALNRYFAYRADGISTKLKELFRIGRRSLVIGLAVLAACLMLSHIAATFFGGREIGSFVSEGLSILGWVANWKPMEIFLYDWWPLAQRRDLYMRLSKASVDVRDDAAAV